MMVASPSRTGLLLALCSIVLAYSGTVVWGVPIRDANLHDHGHEISKRGVPVPQYTRVSGDSAIEEINASQGIARWSAANAVGSAVGRDFANQRATTAQYVAQFTVPVTKEQAGRVFHTIAHYHRAADVNSALASNNAAIWRAASNAASTNYDQALQAQRAGYHRGGGGGHGGGGYSSGGGGHGNTGQWAY